MKNKLAFSLLEVILSVAVFAMLMASVLEGLRGTSGMSETIRVRSDLRVDAENLLFPLADKLIDADLLEYNTDDGINENTGFSRVQYQETFRLYPEATPQAAVTVTHEALQQQYPTLADVYTPVGNELDLIPDGLTGVDKDNLPGFFVIVDTLNIMIYTGVCFEYTNKDGTVYRESLIVFNTFKGDLN